MATVSGHRGPTSGARACGGDQMRGPPSPLDHAGSPWVRPKAERFARARGLAAQWALNDVDRPRLRPGVAIGGPHRVLLPVPSAVAERPPSALNLAGGPCAGPQAARIAEAHGRAAPRALNDADWPGWRLSVAIVVLAARAKFFNRQKTVNYKKSALSAAPTGLQFTQATTDLLMGT